MNGFGQVPYRELSLAHGVQILSLQARKLVVRGGVGSHVEREHGYSGWNQQRLEPDSHGMPLEKRPPLKWPSLPQRGRDVSTGTLEEEK